MNCLKKYLRKIDIFGVNLNFKYQSKDSFTTPIGGLFIVFFCLIALSLGIYYFIPFYQRKNLSIIYYTMNLPKTEQIKLKESEAAFSIGFNCEETELYNVNDLFYLESRFVIFTKDSQGNYNKKKSVLPWHYCTYKDFYNKYNDSLDYLNLNTFQCLDDYGENIEGFYSDKIFSYYEFALTSKNRTKENYEMIYNYLSGNDCKLVLYYTDITIDLSNYKEPIKPFLNSIFIQLNPTLDIKQNVYFMNQYLFDDDFFFAVFQGDEKPKQIQTLFSRYEEYALYMGLNWTGNNYEYAKIFMRADIKKTIIKRTYQKLTEFYADSSSLLIALYEILIIIFSFINNFYAEQAISNKLFLFKELNGELFNNKNVHKKIIHLSKMTGLDYKSENKNKNSETVENDNNIRKHKSIRRKSTKKFSRNNLILTNEYETTQDVRSGKNISINEEINPTNGEKETEKEDKIKRNMNKMNSVNRIMRGSNSRRKTVLSEIDEIKKEDDNLEKSKELSFNILEVFWSQLFPCYIKGKLKLKRNLYNQASDYLKNKLDIVLYLRNVILFEILNKTVLEENKKNIINLLSRPVIFTNKTENEEPFLFYQNYTKNDIDKFYENMIDLMQKTNKEEKEKKLMLLAKQKIKEII